jgi:hypothetical protein
MNSHTAKQRARQLSMWVVYAQPSDFPDDFIAREWLCGTSTQATANTVISRTLDPLRAQLAGKGLVRIERMPGEMWTVRVTRCCSPRSAPGDDPCILEVWL